jgi:3-dehydroquinate dehydratase II
MPQLLLLNGPNLNLLGTREPGLYGADTLDAIVQRTAALARELGHELTARQSNAEHEMVEIVQAAPRQGVVFMILNPGAFTHTSVALRDAILGVALPFIEVHISNVHAREPFRKHSYFSDIAVGQVVGLGPLGYELALRAAAARLAASR